MKHKPATEPQKDYAISLGIFFPPDISKDEMSYLISMKLDDDQPPTDRHKAFAQCFSVDVPNFIGKKALFDRIKWALDESGRENELVEWFVFRVYRQLVHRTNNAPIDNPKHKIIAEIANHLTNSKSVVKSIRKYHGRDLIAFGEWFSPNGQCYQGGSINTIAYQETASLLSEKLGLPYSSSNEKPYFPPPVKNSAKSKKQKKTEKNNGCASIIVLLFFIYVIYLFIK